MATSRQNQSRSVRQTAVQKPLTKKPISQTSTPRRLPSSQQPPSRNSNTPLSNPYPRASNPYPPASNSYPPASNPYPPASNSYPPPSNQNPPPTNIPSSQPLPHHATIINNSNDINTGDGSKIPHHSMEQPSSVLPKDTTEKPYLDYLNDYVPDWKDPVNLEPIRSPRFQNAGRISPKLRSLGTPPSLVSYQNRYNLGQSTSTLPPLPPSLFSDPADLDTFGLGSIDYPFNNDLDSYERQPSVLSHYKLGSRLPKQSKPFSIEPHLNVPLPFMNNDIGTFSLPSGRMAAPAQEPNPRHPDFERLDSFTLPRVQHEPSNLEYIPHEAFTNRYVDDFIGKCIEDQFVPDILHETINELGHEKKKQSARVHKHVVDPNFMNIDKHIDQNERENTHLFSDDWVHELGYQPRLRIPIPASNVDSRMSLLRRIDFKEAPPMRINAPLRFHDLMPEVQTHMLTDYDQELIDFELNDMLRDISRSVLADRPRDVPVMHTPRRDTYHEIKYDPPKRPTDQGQYKSIEKCAENNLLDAICLDNLIARYTKRPNSLLDYDDHSRLLDGTILDNLIHQYYSRDEYH